MTFDEQTEFSVLAKLGCYQGTWDQLVLDTDHSDAKKTKMFNSDLDFYQPNWWTNLEWRGVAKN